MKRLFILNRNENIDEICNLLTDKSNKDCNNIVILTNIVMITDLLENNLIKNDIAEAYIHDVDIILIGFENIVCSDSGLFSSLPADINTVKEFLTIKETPQTFKDILNKIYTSSDAHLDCILSTDSFIVYEKDPYTDINTMINLINDSFSLTKSPATVVIRSEQNINEYRHKTIDIISNNQDYISTALRVAKEFNFAINATTKSTANYIIDSNKGREYLTYSLNNIILPIEVSNKLINYYIEEVRERIE